jgi:hypothetical protein
VHARSEGEDFTLSASKVNSHNAQRHLESTTLQLHESEAKLRTLFTSYKKLETKYAQSEKKWQQILRGPVTPPLSLSTINCREEMFERERIRVEELEVSGWLMWTPASMRLTMMHFADTCSISSVYLCV